MKIEDQNKTEKVDTELPILDLDDMEETELGEANVEDIEAKARPNKGKRFKTRRNIEDLLEERALRRQLSDVFDDDILLD